MYKVYIVHFVNFLLGYGSISFSHDLHGQHSLVKYDYPINTDLYDEISPVISFDKDKIFFTRIGSPDFHPTLYIDSTDVSEIYDSEEYRATLKRVFTQIASGEINDVVSSPYNQDVWIIDLDEYKKSVNLYHPGYPLNDALPNSICSRFDDHERFILINQFDKNGGLEKGFSISQKTANGFSFPEPLHIEGFYVKSSSVNITSSKNQEALILSMPSDSGDMNLYVSFRILDMHYSEPILLTGSINSEWDEVTPFLSRDANTMYFASNRPGTRGGKDIFKVERLDETYLRWGDPELLEFPVNSSFDELYPCLMEDEKKLLFTSNRDGSHDIFIAALARNENIKVTIEVAILNGTTRKNMPGELSWGPAYEKGREQENYFRSRDGKHLIQITLNKPFRIQAVNRNLTSDAVIVDPQEIINRHGGTFKIELVLQPDEPNQISYQQKEIEVLPFEKILEQQVKNPNKTISAVFKNIMFEKSTANILDRSLPSIFTLGKFLKSNKQINIEIIGHTDNVGEEDALLLLSLERANAIKNLLIKQGIAPERMTTTGMGRSNPIADNESEVSRKLNRRVEIRML